MPSLTAQMPLAVYSPVVGLPPRTLSQHLLYGVGVTLAATLLGGVLGVVAAGFYNWGCTKGSGCRPIKPERWMRIGSAMGVVVGLGVSVIAVVNPQHPIARSSRVR